MERCVFNLVGSVKEGSQNCQAKQKEHLSLITEPNFRKITLSTVYNDLDQGATGVSGIN